MFLMSPIGSLILGHDGHLQDEVEHAFTRLLLHTLFESE